MPEKLLGDLQATASASHLKDGLRSLLEAKKMHSCLSLQQAIDLSLSSDRLEDIVKSLELKA